MNSAHYKNKTIFELTPLHYYYYTIILRLPFGG